MRKRGEAEHKWYSCTRFGIRWGSQLTLHKRINANSLWCTDSWWIAFGCSPNICCTAECCLPCFGNTSTLNNRFVFACRICVLFAFRCKPGFRLDHIGAVKFYIHGLLESTKLHNQEGTRHRWFLRFWFSFLAAQCYFQIHPIWILWRIKVVHFRIQIGNSWHSWTL